jgi:hypothetical protein
MNSVGHSLTGYGSTLRLVDVVNAMMTGTSARWQAEHETWAIDGGVDHDGDALDVSVAIEGDVIVVTVY